MSPVSCPQCGASLESTERVCSYCGAVVSTASSGSAPTIQASREELDALLKDTSAPSDATVVSSEPLPLFGNSAQAMDAIKAELRAGRKAEAVRLYRAYFKTAAADAQTAVEQIEYNLKFDTVVSAPVSEKTMLAQPGAFSAFERTPELPAQEPARKATLPVWVWGCAAAFLLFCCLCVVVPAALYLLSQNM